MPLLEDAGHYVVVVGFGDERAVEGAGFELWRGPDQFAPADIGQHAVENARVGLLIGDRPVVHGMLAVGSGDEHRAAIGATGNPANSPAGNVWSGWTGGQFTTQAPAPSTAMNVDVIGHQFWWEFQYPDANVVTANELHLPIGKAAKVSTGEPKVTMLARAFERR